MEKLEKRHHPLYEPLAAIVGSKYLSDEDFAGCMHAKRVLKYLEARGESFGGVKPPRAK